MRLRCEARQVDLVLVSMQLVLVLLTLPSMVSLGLNLVTTSPSTTDHRYVL